tara:strand:+ start:1288 stop:3444 length:2157 start_codon:yes stop_codon:yes gene_type:complete
MFKSIIKITTIIALLFSFSSINAQKCGTDHTVYEQMLQDPVSRKQIEQLYEQAQLAPSGNKAPTIVVPVVVHVIHSNGVGNISLAQIQDGIDKINRDFNKSNADTSQIRSVFANLAGKADIEFRLAKIDPNGQCTEGVTRVNSYLTYNQRNEVKALAQWDENKYFNVWLVNSIRSGGGTGTTLGYAQFPFSTNASTLNTYGIVVRNDEWGGIGTASGGNGRTVTHEMGHCFNLLHTFQSGCGSSCSNSGDRICDTPPAANETFGCTLSNNTCSNDASGPSAFSTNVPDQLENYMSYDDCQFMFTQNQVSVMRASLANSAYPWMQNMVSASNLVATGTNDNYVPQNCPPIVHIESPNKIILGCVGDTITFTDNYSYNGPVQSYNWTLSGATPSTSTDNFPSVVYSAPGKYDYTLAVTGQGGTTSQFISQKIIITDGSSTPYNGVLYEEDFQNPLKVFNEYIVENPTGTTKWERTSTAGFNSSASFRLNNNARTGTIFSQGFGEVESFITPSIDMSNVSNPKLEFKIAYQKRSASSSDNIEIQTSTDCGNTWTNRWSFANGDILGSNGTSQADFIPTTSSQWTTASVFTFQGNLNGQSNVMFKIKYNARDGNNVYIDDLKVFGTSIVGVDENSLDQLNLSIYPNPTRDDFTLSFDNNKATSTNVYLTDITGKRMINVLSSVQLPIGLQKQRIGTESLKAGIYFIVLEQEGNRVVRKLIIQ